MRRVTLPSDPDLWATIKEHDDLGWEDRVFTQSAARIVASSRDPEEVTGMTMRLVAKMVVAWNLKDKSGNPLPVDAEALRVIVPKDGDFLAGEVLPLVFDEKPARTQEEQAFFTTSSTPRSRRKTAIKSRSRTA